MDSTSINLFIADKIALIIGGAGAYIIWLASRYIVNNGLARVKLGSMGVEYRTFTVNGQSAKFGAGDLGFFSSRITYTGKDEITPRIQNSKIINMDIRISHSTNGGSNGKTATKD